MVKRQRHDSPFQLICRRLRWVFARGLSPLQRAGALSCCAVQASRRGASLTAERGLAGVWAALVVAHRLSCPVACGIFVPGPGLEPVSPALAS